MGERKVLNNYVPPDFDPSIIPRMKRQKDKLVEVRMMLPFSLRCKTCGEYMYRGKKFNSMSEFVQGDDYLGIKKLRFYIKCTNCSAEITFKTDPKNADYECESGALRNFELWRDTQEAMEKDEKEREEEEIDPMKNLEHRTMDNKIEMDILDALDEMKAINSRHQRVNTDKVLETIAKKHGGDTSNGNEVAKRPEDISISAEEEAMIKQMFAKKQHPSSVDTSSSVSSTSQSAPSVVKHLAQHITSASSSNLTSASNNGSSSRPGIAIVSRKRKVDAVVNSEDSLNATSSAAKKATLTTTSETSQKEQHQLPVDTAAAQEIKNSSNEDSTAALGFLMGYGDDDDE
jgi:hypothetical protein